MLLNPGFSYGAGPTVVQLTIAQSPWLPSAERVGGSRVLASGLPINRTIRRDYLLGLALRVKESEFLALQAMVADRQDRSGTDAQFSFRIDPTAPWIACYLHKPTDDLVPGRGTYMGELTVALTLRKADGTAWDINYFGAP